MLVCNEAEMWPVCGLQAPFSAKELPLIRAGLIAADCVNMVLRIAFSLAYTRRLFTAVPSFRIAAFVPTTSVLVALAAAFLATGDTSFAHLL